MRSAVLTQLPLVVVLLGVALLVSSRLPVSGAEAHALWVVRDFPAPNATVTDRLQTDMRTLTDRVRQEQVSPLYALVLNVWTQLFGDEVRIARLLSLGLAIAGAAIITATVGMSYRTMPVTLLIGLAALVPAVRADGYAAILLTSALALWARLRLNQNPAISRVLIYAITSVLLLYTAPLILPMLLLHLLVTQTTGNTNRVVFGVLLLAVACYVPWLLLMQPGARTALISDETLMAWLVAALPIAIWYVVQMWHVPERWPAVTAIMATVALAVVCAGLLSLDAPDFLTEVRSMRTADEPVIYNFPHDQPLNYYNAHDATRLTAGLAVDVGWREGDATILQQALAAVNSAPIVWVMLPKGAREWTAIDTYFAPDAVLSYDRAAQGMRVVRYARQINTE